MKRIDKLRPCIKKCLEHGVANSAFKDSDDFLVMRHAIISDFYRVGIPEKSAKTLILQWNDKCTPPLAPNKARSKLIRYTEWVYKKECRISCKKLSNYCLYPDGDCPFQHKKINSLNYNIYEAVSFLEKNYPQYGRGYVAGLVLNALKDSRNDKGVNVLFCSMRELAERVMHKNSHRLEPMQVSRAVRLLEEAGFISMESGTTGIGKRQANTYRFLNWSPNITHITHG